ncbi:inositol monophosphatase [bacterium]|nr:inositol monophosphatase [bacterium]
MTANDLQTLTARVIELVREVGEYVRGERERVQASEIEIKGQGDYVSRVDRESEDRLRTGLTAMLPGSTFMGEEDSPDARGGDWRWIVDPIDGTANYLAGLPTWSISVALEDRRENPDFFGPLTLGVVAEPALNVIYDAWRGGGARKNGDPIHVSADRPLEHGIVATAFPFRRRQKLEDYLKLFTEIYPLVSDFRRIGSAAADLCWVADGTFDGYFEMGLKPWDVAAGALIIEEAGGKISDWWGKPVCETGWTVTGNAHAYDTLRAIIDKHNFTRPEILFH